MRSKTRLNNWNDLQYVIVTARLGSFRAAAVSLGTDQSTVGRRIARFETRVGTRIFERHRTGMQLTPAGQVLVEKAVRMEEIAQNIEADVLALDSRMSGVIRVFATDGLGYLWLAPALVDFCHLHPAISIDLITDRRGPDLLSLKADIGVFLERPRSPRLVVSKAVKIDHSLFMSRSYEERYGRPRKIEDLRHHLFLDYVPYHVCAGLGWWKKQISQAGRVQMRVDSAAVGLAAIRRGVGIGLLPDFYRRVAPDLIPLSIPLPTACVLNLWMVSSLIANKAHRINVLLRFLRKRFDDDRADWFVA